MSSFDKIKNEKLKEMIAKDLSDKKTPWYKGANAMQTNLKVYLNLYLM